MHIIDSHFHWWPRSIFETLMKRKDFPRADHNKRGGYTFWGPTGREETYFGSWREWHDIDDQLAHMDGLGHQIDVVCSIGPFSVVFSYMDKIMGRDYAIHWNEEMAKAQQTHPGRVWASAAVPLVDTQIAIDVVDHAINKLGLMGVNLPSSVGDDARIDAERLEPFYDYVEKLGVPLFLHPTDAVFQEMLGDGYDGALFRSLGRVVEVSTAAMRLVFSGIMERHPNLKLVMSHTGGALPYQSGRMDKNGKGAKLPHNPSDYIHRFYTDTVTPHTQGMKWAIEYFGADRVMYGTDYPCWDPATCLQLFNEMNLSEEDQHKIFYANARRILNLKDPAPANPVTAREMAPAK
ncbi:MAG TPA: amidohydrolase family protein [Stellaceae bacterium]|jgi:aminocarboxymuconate-semialdehyde decarboxylase|nr:amidohydrolase family protein [Stellaceae bacterium]